MKVLIFGRNGQLANSLYEIREKNWFFISSSECNFENKDQILEILNKYTPEVIINTSAYTNVDLAESEKEKAFSINAYALKVIGKWSSHAKAKLIHISTDYVFSGEGEDAFNENDKRSPVNVYGDSKLLGEKYVEEFASDYSIIRTSWVFSPFGKNFVKTMLFLGKEKDSLSVIDDQVGSPTYAPDLARFIKGNLNNLSKIEHFTNSGDCSWYDFSKEIMIESKLKCKISPISSSDYKTAALRPLNSRLFKTRKSRHWKLALKECLEQLRR